MFGGTQRSDWVGKFVLSRKYPRRYESRGAAAQRLEKAIIPRVSLAPFFASLRLPQSRSPKAQSHILNLPYPK